MTAEVGVVDLDRDHTSGNEIVLVSKDLGKDAAFDSFSWNGEDMSHVRVDAGTYQLYAKLSDGVNADRFVPGLATRKLPRFGFNVLRICRLGPSTTTISPFSLAT